MAMKMCAKAKRIDKVEQLYHWMDIHQVAPNVITMTTLIQAYGRVNNLDKAFEVVFDLKKRGIPPDNRLYNALLQACVLSENLEKALEVVQLVEQDGLKPEVVMYTTLLNLCYKSKDPEQAWELFTHMKNTGDQLTPNLVSYNTILSTLTQAEEFDKFNQVEAWLREEEDMKLNVETYTTLLRHCSRTGDLKKYDRNI
eukprot:UN32897